MGTPALRKVKEPQKLDHLAKFGTITVLSPRGTRGAVTLGFNPWGARPLGGEHQ